MNTSSFARTLLLAAAVSGCRTVPIQHSGPKAIFAEDGSHLPDRDADGTAVSWRALDREHDGITGVGVLGVFQGTVDVCTASLIDTGVSTGPAYVLTNAHCNFFEHWGFDPLGATEFRSDLPTSYSVTFQHFVDVPVADRKTFPLRRLTYVTEAGTDMALFEVKASLAELRTLEINPLRLADQRPAVETGVRLVGVPLAFVSDEKMSLHVSTCKVMGEASIINGDYAAPVSAVHRCSSVPGFSGGPLLNAAGEIALLNSHGAADESTDAPCTYATRPCEVRADGTRVVVEDVNYAQYVDGLAGCFDEGGVFSLQKATCLIPK